MLNALLTRFFRFGGYRPADDDDAVSRLYDIAVRQARHPHFYAERGVADTVDGRFDMIVLHVFLLIRRLQRQGERGRAQAQALFDLTFQDMDRNLREMGVGDLGVGRRVKDMARAFYGRADAYGRALDAGDRTALGEALQRNLLGGEGEDERSLALADYVRRADQDLAAIDDSALMTGTAAFPAQPGDPE
jgi:cytochrome b pre-mRNA-processing protein 3